jgi:branched-chain amino acid transport system permease protein
MVGGLVIGIIESFVGGSQWSSYRDAIAFVILIVILLVRPSGLFGKYEAEKV